MLVAVALTAELLLGSEGLLFEVGPLDKAPKLEEGSLDGGESSCDSVSALL